MTEPRMHFPDKFDRDLNVVEDGFKPHDERCTCAHGHAILCPQHAEEAMTLMAQLPDHQ